MADNFLDSVNWDDLLKKYMTQQSDPKAPLNAGLMAAGLGMLANSYRGAAGGIGAGGLMGLQAYQDERTRQQKDPMQMIGLANAVEALKQNQQGTQWLNKFNATPQPQQPQYGMQNRDSGEMPMPQAPALGGQMPISDILGGVGLPGRAGKLAEMLYKQSMEAPTKAGPGDTLFSRNPYTGALEQGQQMPNLDKNLEMTPQGVRPYQGAVQAAAQLAGATKGAEAAAQAPYTPVQTMQGGVPVTTTAAALAAAQNAPQGALPSDIQTLYADYVKNGGPERGEPFKLNYMPKPQARLGVGLSKADEAAAVAQATLPTEMSKTFSENLGKYSVENFAAGHKAAEEAAYTELPAIKDVRQRLAAGAFAGGGAEAKTAALNTINGWFGTSIASPQVAQSQALNSALGKQLLANAKRLGANPTEADSKRIDNIVGKQGLSPEALKEIADVQEKMAMQAIDRHNKRLDSMESVYKERGIPTDTISGLRVKAPDMEVQKTQGSSNPQLRAIEEEILRRRGMR